MKATVSIPTEIFITHVRIHVPVRYGEEDIPNDFPLRKFDTWEALVNIDTGQIENWPQGQSGNLYMKVCDSGTYSLYDNEKLIASIEDYVPHGVVPGEYGDYIDLEITPTGHIQNWPKKPHIGAWFVDKED